MESGPNNCFYCEADMRGYFCGFPVESDTRATSAKDKRIAELEGDMMALEPLTPVEQQKLLAEAEQLWRDLQANELGGFSGGNRPFWIVHQFKRVIEKFGNRDVGLNWSKDELEAARKALTP